MNWSIWLTFFVVFIIIMVINYSRKRNDQYQVGSRMFENSEFNLNEEKRDFSDESATLINQDRLM